MRVMSRGHVTGGFSGTMIETPSTRKHRHDEPTPVALEERIHICFETQRIDRLETHRDKMLTRSQ